MNATRKSKALFRPLNPAAAGLMILGLGLIAFLFARCNADDIAEALWTVGWRGLLLVCLVYLFAMAICGLAWASLLPRPSTQTMILVVLVRWIRDALGGLVPLGGELIALRLLALGGIRAATAGASIVVDLTVELASQLHFTALGVALLFVERLDDRLAYWLLAGLSMATLAALIFFLIQRASAHRTPASAARAEDGRSSADPQSYCCSHPSLFGSVPVCVATRLGVRPLAGILGVRDEIEAIYRRPSRMMVGFGLHLLGWIAGVAEAWIALRLLGAPLAFVEVLTIESIAFAARSAAFAVPGGLGVQEGAYVMLGALFGLSPETALALALVKRGRELALVVPAMLVWQFLEGKIYLRGGARQIAQARELYIPK